MNCKKATKTSVYFKHNCWNHRYAKICDNDQKEYGSITGFKAEDESHKKLIELQKDKLSGVQKLLRLGRMRTYKFVDDIYKSRIF